MPSQVTNYKCPNCGGPLHFDAESQKLKCDYCGSLFTNEEVDAFYAKKNEEAAAAPAQFTPAEAGFSEEEQAHLRAYSCPSCGAQLITDDTTAATTCPYCNNPTVVPSQLSGELKPKYVIPFAIKKEDAIAKLKEFYKGKSLLPTAFSEENHLDEIKGIYVPFWLYSATINADLAYHATRTRVYTRGDDQITEISHFQVVRKGEVDFANVPADASKKMSDEYMDAVEPYDYSKMVDFEMSYLPGYFADRYDITDDEDQKRTDLRMKNSAVAAISNSIIGYDSVIPERQYLTRHNSSTEYALLPVWVLATKYNNKDYLFIVNGQTGKLVGSLPMDTSKAIRYFLIILAIVMVIAVVAFIAMGK